MIENTIFNPMFYGTSHFEKNTYGNIDDVGENDCVNFNIETKFNSELYVNNNINFDSKSKLINVNTLNSMETNKLFDVLKIDEINNDLKNITTDYFQYKTNNEKNINNLQNDLLNLIDKYEQHNTIITTNINTIGEIENNLNILMSDYDNFKSEITKDIKIIKSKCLNFMEINKNILLDKFEYDIYIIYNGVNITLPLINDEIIGRKIKIVNTCDNTSKIIINNKNNINQSEKHIYMLRNLNSINIMAINMTTWLFFN